MILNVACPGLPNLCLLMTEQISCVVDAIETNLDEEISVFIDYIWESNVHRKQ